MALEIGRYTELKAKKAVTIVKIGAAFAWSTPKFDPTTGAELAPEIGAIDLAALEQERAKQAAVVAQYDALIEDLKAL